MSLERCDRVAIATWHTLTHSPMVDPLQPIVLDSVCVMCVMCVYACMPVAPIPLRTKQMWTEAFYWSFWVIIVITKRNSNHFQFDAGPGTVPFKSKGVLACFVQSIYTKTCLLFSIFVYYLRGMWKQAWQLNKPHVNRKHIWIYRLDRTLVV